MRPTAKQAASPTSWPPETDEIVTFQSADGLRTGIVKEVRWGLVWRDFILEDGRVIPEHKILNHPEPPVWRNAEEVTQAEREACEIRLVSMAEAGLDPRDKEQSFWAELNQYLAYTYLRFKHSQGKAPGSD
ncbi:MAG: hypothetical protein ACM3WP_08060 [Acidobacteriota bacterium]